MLDFDFFFFLHCSDEFNAGFGSHTPMILGQAKVVRYFPNYERWRACFLILLIYSILVEWLWKEHYDTIDTCNWPYSWKRLGCCCNCLALKMIVIFKCHRTLEIAKTVMKERSFVHSKTDKIIHLSKDGKLEEVSCWLLI